MKKYPLSTLIFLSAHLFSVCQAQSQFSGWFASFNTIKISNKTSIANDIQLRSTDEIKQLQTFLFRTGLNYHLNKKITITTGYAFIRNNKIFGNLSGYTPEHRIWEQLLLTHKLKIIFISHRFRVEQRFIGKSVAGGNQLSDGPKYANRFRYFIRNILPLKKTTEFKKGMFAALQNEVFVNFGNTETVNGEFFDQNRLYLAAGYRVSSKADVEIGYLNQYVNGRGSQFTKNHVVQAAAYFRL